MEWASGSRRHTKNSQAMPKKPKMNLRVVKHFRRLASKAGTLKCKNHDRDTQGCESSWASLTSSLKTFSYVFPSCYQGWNMPALHSLAWGNTTRHKIMPGSLQRQVSPGFIPLSWQMFLKLSEKNPKTMMSSFFTTNESQTCSCIQINICFSVAKQPDSSKNQSCLLFFNYLLY